MKGVGVPLLVSGGLVIAIVVLVFLGALVAVVAAQRRRERGDQDSIIAAGHRDAAGASMRSAEQATITAQEHAARGERQGLEAEQLARRAAQERAAAEHHEAQAREIDPDTDS
jgi:hypothetical protein